MRVGTTDNQGRTYFRCTECGDSRNQQHCHAFYDREGRTHCFRCGWSGTLPIGRLVDIALGECSVDEALDEWLIPSSSRAMPTRHTLLTSFSNELGVDGFPMHNISGRTIGWHTRQPGRKGVNMGRRGFSWMGVSDDLPLTSAPDQPLVLVEGPYDVVQSHYVACFGLITPSVLERLRLHHLWVWPDPDQLTTPEDRERVVHMLATADREHCFVHGLIVSNADPDECTVKAYVPTQHLADWLQYGSRRWLRA